MPFLKSLRNVKIEDGEQGKKECCHVLPRVNSVWTVLILSARIKEDHPLLMPGNSIRHCTCFLLVLLEHLGDNIPSNLRKGFSTKNRGS